MSERILIIEDEAKIARVLQLELEHEGYTVGWAKDGREGLELAMEQQWDIVLLDIMLPKLNGIEVLRRIRQSNQDIPVILLTARDTVPDKVSGFEHGANDYVTKPFAIEELLARIRNLLRIFQQKDQDSSPVIRIDDLEINEASREVQRDGTAIELTPKEFDLLNYLAKNKNNVNTREQILSDVWGYEFIGDTNVIDVYIRYLRQKIDSGRKRKLIHTSRGVGYILKEPEM